MSYMGIPISGPQEAKKLVKCSDCGKEISAKAKACPSCGAPPPSEKIKDAVEGAAKDVLEGTLGCGALGCLLPLLFCVMFAAWICHESPEEKEASAEKSAAEVFMETFSWQDMETIEAFQDRFPSGVVFRHEKWTGGKTRRLKANFPGGGTIVLVARPCSEVAGSGLCVWTTYPED